MKYCNNCKNYLDEQYFPPKSNTCIYCAKSFDFMEYIDEQQNFYEKND